MRADGPLDDSADDQAALNLRRTRLAEGLQQRLMSNVAGKTTDGAESFVHNDPAAYTDAHWLAEERAHLFQALPLVAGLSSDLPKPGDRLLFDAAGPPILIIRGSDDRVRAFLNICPHRAARLVTKCGAGARLTCPFHGWTFSLDGALIGLPGLASFEGLDRSQVRLQPVPVAEWNGLIFVIARPGDDAIDVPAYLGALASEVADLQLSNARFVKQTRLDARSNWKYTLDTFGEGYHVAVLHPGTVGRFLICDSIIYDEYRPHHRMCFANRGMAEDAHKPRSQWPAAQLRLVYLLFPNTIIQYTPLGGGYNIIIYRIFPGGCPGESFTFLESYQAGEVGGEGDLEPWLEAHDYQVSIVGGEDYPMAETAQRNLNFVPPGWRMLYGRNEIALQRFQRSVAERIGRRTLPRRPRWRRQWSVGFLSKSQEQMMAEKMYEGYEALQPFFDLIMGALKGRVEADHFFDLFDDDGVWEYGFVLPGQLQSVQGRDHIAKHFRGYGEIHWLDRVCNLITHETKDAVILEPRRANGPALPQSLCLGDHRS